MSDDQKVPPDPSTESEAEHKRSERVPPFEPDLDAITYIERGPSPLYAAKRIFPRDPGAEARRLARKRGGEKGE